MDKVKIITRHYSYRKVDAGISIRDLSSGYTWETGATAIIQIYLELIQPGSKVAWL